MRRPYEEEFLRWYTQARDEYRDADDLRKRKRFYLALFHFQQSAEKALKAYLYLRARSVQVLYTHSVSELLRIATASDRMFLKVRNAGKLDSYYIPTRYPNGLPGSVPSRYFDDPKEALAAKKLAGGLITLVKARSAPLLRAARKVHGPAVASRDAEE